MHEMRHVDNAQHIWLGRERRAIAYIYHAISVPGLNVQQQIGAQSTPAPSLSPLLPVSYVLINDDCTNSIDPPPFSLLP